MDTETLHGNDYSDYEEDGCCFPGECCMPGFHLKSECHTADMIENSIHHEALPELDEDKVTIDDATGKAYWMGTEVLPCVMCGLSVVHVDDCGEFGNPDCPRFGTNGTNRSCQN